LPVWSVEALPARTALIGLIKITASHHRIDFDQAAPDRSRR
jgi:hypothetical protein